VTAPPAQRSAATQALLAAAAGDIAAFGRVVDLLGARLLGLIRVVVGDHDVAVELTRRVLVEAWRDAPAFRMMDRTAETWLLARGHRRAVAWRRERDGGAPDADAGAAAAPGRRALRPAVAELDGLERRVLEAAYVGGATCDEAADQLGVSVGTVRLLLHRALRHLGPRLLGRGSGDAGIA
jgi:RNA polymerase sigma-70 factor (ECF subfamily)